MLAAIGRRVQRVFQKSSSPLLNLNSAPVNKSSSIWKYKTTRRSFSTSLFRKDVSALREELNKFIRQYPKEIDFKTANNGIEQLLKSAKNPAEEVECYNARALMCLQSADPQGALEALDKSIALVPLKSSVMVRAFALSFLGKTEEALKDFKRAYDHSPAQAMIEIWNSFIGFGYRIKEYQSGALNVLKRAIQIFPNDEHVAQAFDTLANALSMSEQEQLQCHLKAADFNPNNVLAWRYAIKLDLNNANQYVTQALLHNPSSHEIIWGTLTAMYMQQKDWTRAFEAAKTLLSAETLRERPKTFEMIFNLFHQTMVLEDTLLDDAGHDLLERVLELDPSNSTAMSLLGRSYYHRREDEQAKEWYTRALKLNDNDVNAVVGLAELSKDVHEQISLFERAIKLEPRLFEVHYALAQHYYQRRQYEQALETIDRVISGSPNVTPEHYFRKAMIHGHLKQYDKELQAYLQHFKMQMNDPLRANQVYLIEHRFEEGLAHNDIHLQKDPNNAALWSFRAEMLQNLGRYNEALDAVEKALGLISNKQRVQILPQKGVILAHLKRTDEARHIAQIIIDEYKIMLPALMIMGEVCFQEGKFDDAAQCFELVIQKNQEVELHRYHKYFNLARALEARGDVTRARELFALVHHINPFASISAERVKQLDGDKQ